MKKYVFREENSRWSSPFYFKNAAIEIDMEIEKDEKNIINTKDISWILSWGQNFVNTRILILQQQFIIYNTLGYDIYYRQDKDKEKTNQFFKKWSFESILQVKEKKYLLRLGLFDINSGEFKYSALFDTGVLKAVDLLIKTMN